VEFIKDVNDIFRYGIVKIRPPPSFNPTFALDMEDFRFRPRLVS
jgi:hypothetical protein